MRGERTMDKEQSGSPQAASGRLVTRMAPEVAQDKLLPDELAEMIHQAVRDNRSYLMEHESKEIPGRHRYCDHRLPGGPLRR